MGWVKLLQSLRRKEANTVRSTQPWKWLREDLATIDIEGGTRTAYFLADGEGSYTLTVVTHRAEEIGTFASLDEAKKALGSS